MHNYVYILESITKFWACFVGEAPLPVWGQIFVLFAFFATFFVLLLASLKTPYLACKSG